MKLYGVPFFQPLTASLLLLHPQATITASTKEDALPLPPLLNDKIVCSSHFADKDYHVELLPDNVLTFHWSHPIDEQTGRRSSWSNFHGALQYFGPNNKGALGHWLGVGFSSDGSMTNSKAVIGVPGSSSSSADGDEVHYFDLLGYDENSVQPNPDEAAAVNVGGHIYTSAVDTTMHFHTHHVYEFAKHAYDQDGVFTFIYAVGEGENKGKSRSRKVSNQPSLTCTYPELPFLVTKPTGFGLHPLSLVSLQHQELH